MWDLLICQVFRVPVGCNLPSLDRRRVILFLPSLTVFNRTNVLTFSIIFITNFVGEKRLRTDYPFRILPFDGILGLAPSASGGSVMHASVLPGGSR